MKKFLLLLLLIIFFGKYFETQAQQQLGSQAEISLMTCSPGTEIYSLFGHSAFRVKDPQNRRDLIFNYGIFDFNTPNFTMKFIRGKLKYKLGVEQYPRFEYQYAVENRQVFEQIFNLNQNQKQKLFDFLINNARPENSEYQYDFFFNNCSSRSVDVLKEVLKDDLIFSTPEDSKFISYRQNLDYYLKGKYPKSPWADFGMDLILGMPADETADLKGEMFLPDHLSKNLSFGLLQNSIPFTQTKKMIVPQKTPSSVANWQLTPLLLFWISCGITGLFFLKNNNTFTRIFDFVLFLILGLGGVLFVFMWAGTDHEVCYKNLNMLWMNPMHILLAISILRKNLNKFWEKYMWVTIVLNMLLILFWKILPQEFHAASFPLILMATMRVAAHLKTKKPT